ncbi:hypothetical protein P4O66_014351 [Electrophorus voltai]|uniref:Uncharacterized protein n=1 Tax=Electrophorus voltai TaxID=2609070 RepID=A0AAD8YZY8_9TELE|nr:hypothetical protein P4O66_014351 [Electrophorus voltai]
MHSSKWQLMERCAAWLELASVVVRELEEESLQRGWLKATIVLGSLQSASRLPSRAGEVATLSASLDHATLPQLPEWAPFGSASHAPGPPTCPALPVGHFRFAHATSQSMARLAIHRASVKHVCEKCVKPCVGSGQTTAWAVTEIRDTDKDRADLNALILRH